MRRVLFSLAICVLGLPTLASAADDLQPLIQKLKSVGRLGAGNARASEAWRRLAAAPAEQLPTLLAALDDAGPLASNWIRAAVDAVAERRLQQGGRLPLLALEKFALDTSHHPRARRLAFEWLARVDKSAPDRLIPGLLHDPSVEFRRDAVSRLLKQAESLKKSDDKAALIALYQKALSGARDKDQVQLLAGELRGLGEEVDLAAHYGYILRWKVTGPFDNTEKKGFPVAYAPEKNLDFAATYRGKVGSVAWKDHVTEDESGLVDCNVALEKHMGAVGYGAAEFISDKKQTVQIRVTSLCAVKVWLNGKLLMEHEVYHAGSTEAIDQYIAAGTMKRGRNVILIKCCQNEQTDSWAQNWDYRLRICDSAGTAILSKDRK